MAPNVAQSAEHGKRPNLPAEVFNTLRFFAYSHLPARLQEVSRPFCDLAHATLHRAPWDPETAVAIRKLLEAKDAAVRAVAALGDTP